MKLAIKRRYWFWQQKKMLADDVGYTVAETLYDELRPLAIRYIDTSAGPGAITLIPAGWAVDYWLTKSIESA
jgi:hypothetical protein